MRDRPRQLSRSTPRSWPSRADALARRLADGPALAYGTTKTLIARELDMDLAGAIELEALDPGADDADRRPRRVLRGLDRRSASRDWKGR